MAQMDYWQGIIDGLTLTYPQGTSPFQVLEVAIRMQPPDRWPALAHSWRDRYPDFKPTKKQRLSLVEDWGLGWPFHGSPDDSE